MNYLEKEKIKKQNQFKSEIRAEFIDHIYQALEDYRVKTGSISRIDVNHIMGCINDVKLALENKNLME